MSEALNRITGIMKTKYGKDISAYDPTFLIKSIEKRTLASGVSNVDAYGCYLGDSAAEAEIFLDSLHITYSHFFREPLTFALLEQYVLPNIIAGKPEGSEVRVWSAGCAGGQEAYSVAMLISDMTQNSGMDIRYRIIATDICEASMALGRAGIYEPGAVQDVREKHLKRYFTKQDGMYAISQRLRKNVSFSHYDLLDTATSNPPESIFGDFDVVLCCNLLIYYTGELQQFIVKKLKRAMAKGGYLVTGEAERSLVEKSSKLKAVSIPSAVFMNYPRSAAI